MRVTPVQHIYNPHPDKPKPQRAMVVVHHDQFTIRDRVTKETIEAHASNWWEIYNEVNNRPDSDDRGILA